MPHPVYLHIGPPKTGTTYVQELLWLNRGKLLEQGILYPADARSHHFHAAVDVVGVGLLEVDTAEAAGRWDDLVALIRGHDGPTVISHENFSGATEEKAARISTDLAGRELHVLLTARNVRSLYESQFQEGLKNGRKWNFDSFVATKRLVGSRGEMIIGRSGTAITTWSAVVPPERFHVIVMPPPGAARTLLFDRFCAVIGFDPSDALLETERVNESIGVVEAELLRRLNRGRGDDWTDGAQLFVKHRLVPHLLAGRKGQRKIRTTDPQTLDALMEQTRLLASTIREHRFDVVGDLAELEAAQAAMPAEPDGGPASDEEVLDVALQSLRWSVVRAAELEAQMRLLASTPLRSAVVWAARRTRLLGRARRVFDRVARNH